MTRCYDIKHQTPNTETLRSRVTTWCQHSGSLGVVDLRTTTTHVVELLHYIRQCHRSLSCYIPYLDRHPIVSPP